MELETPIGLVGTPLQGIYFKEQSPTRGMSIDLASLGLRPKRGFQPTVVMQPEVYDFVLDPTMHMSHLYNPISLIEPIDITIPQVKRGPDMARTFGGEAFEGEATAVGLVAGAIIVCALVAGGLYASYQISKVFEFGQSIMAPGIELAGAAVEAIIPGEEE